MRLLIFLAAIAVPVLDAIPATAQRGGSVRRIERHAAEVCRRADRAAAKEIRRAERRAAEVCRRAERRAAKELRCASPREARRM